MSDEGRQAYWDSVYVSKGEAGVSWFESMPAASLDLIQRCGATASTSLIDIGGGASCLVDRLLGEGMTAVAVLDLSAAALAAAKARLGASSAGVEWIVADVTRWMPARHYDVWHDRAAFHFLTESSDRAAYVERLCAALRPGGYAIVATFAPDGPEHCSGLPVMRYDAAALAAVFGPQFRLVGERRHIHVTPWGATQAFQFSVLRRVDPES